MCVGMYLYAARETASVGFNDNDDDTHSNNNNHNNTYIILYTCIILYTHVIYNTSSTDNTILCPEGCTRYTFFILRVPLHSRRYKHYNMEYT